MRTRQIAAVVCALALSAGACDDESGTVGEDDGTGAVLDVGSDVETTASEVREDASDGCAVACGTTCCAAGETCADAALGVCAPSTCTTPTCGAVCCGAGEVCDEGTCSPTCASGGPACGGVCCAADQLCDSGRLTCAAACADGRAMCNGVCCGADKICEDGQCRADCADRCGDRPETERCCASTEVCEAGACTLECGATARCGTAGAEICCAAGEVCEAGTCKAECGGERCGPMEGLCCVGSEICLFDTCLEPGSACTDDLDCALDEFCELGSGFCIAVDDDPNQCIYVPPVGQFAPEPQWEWSGSPAFPGYDQVMMTPIVVNLTDDNGDGTIDEADIPDVVFGTFTGGGYNNAGVIRVVSGDDGRELAASNAAPFSVSSDLGAADIDGDGRAEIVVSDSRYTTPKSVHALELLEDGAGGYTLVVQDSIQLAGFADAYGATTAAFADIEGDGTVEVVSQYGVIEGSPFQLRCEASFWFPIVANLDEVGEMEIISQGAIYDGNCNQLVSGASGTAAVADLLPDSGVGDLGPEIIWVRPGRVNGTVELWNVTRQPTGEWGMDLVWATTIPINAARIASLNGGLVCTSASTETACNTGGGPPTIADFDGDGAPEIGLAARWYYTVIETDGSILWADGGTKDFSSAVTGSSVFDFEGDGRAEVVYNDEDTLRVYAGDGAGVDADGDGFDDPVVLYDAPNPSGTLYEYPLIVDVDNDGNAEIVLAANNYAFPGTNGIRVFRDPFDNWVRTRRVWNQHTYHVTHIEEDGTIPVPQRHNWRVPKLNNFRQNVQPGGLFNAPNLQVEGVVSSDMGCPNTRGITVTVGNAGSLGVGPGVWVGVYAVNLPAPDSRALLGRVQLTEAILPGRSVEVTLAWDYTGTLLPSGVTTTFTSAVDVEAVVDDPPMAPGQNGDHNECVETDNTAAAAVPIAPCPAN